jgi:alcohol dehydrogenase class IV
MQFEFATANRILFGPGTVRQVPTLARELGRRVLLVTGRSFERAQPLAEALVQAGLSYVPFAVRGEPTTDQVAAGVATARAELCDVVVGMGGGAALDAAKAIAALLANPGELLDYLEVVGRGQPLSRAPVPWLAIPTTAGTGTEVTRNAVLASPAHQVKASLRSRLLLPVAAVVDPELTLSLSPEVTARTGLDALTQLIEPYVSLRANPITDPLCVEGLRRVARSLRRAVQHGHDLAARQDMALAALFSGLALANAGLGAVHGFAAPIGGMFPAPHGAVCAALLPHVMEVNLRALRERAPDSEALRRYDEVARVLTGQPQARAEDGVGWVRTLCAELQVQPLRFWGVRPDHFALLSDRAAAASSMKANPIVLTVQERLEILQRAT